MLIKVRVGGWCWVAIRVRVLCRVRVGGWLGLGVEVGKYLKIIDYSN